MPTTTTSARRRLRRRGRRSGRRPSRAPSTQRRASRGRRAPSAGGERADRDEHQRRAAGGVGRRTVAGRRRCAVRDTAGVARRDGRAARAGVAVPRMTVRRPRIVPRARGASRWLAAAARGPCAGAGRADGTIATRRRHDGRASPATAGPPRHALMNSPQGRRVPRATAASSSPTRSTTASAACAPNGDHPRPSAGSGARAVGGDGGPAVDARARRARAASTALARRRLPHRRHAQRPRPPRCRPTARSRRWPGPTPGLRGRRRPGRRSPQLEHPARHRGHCPTAASSSPTPATTASAASRPTAIITTVAGTAAGFGGDGGPATAAQLDAPRDVALAADGGDPDRRHRQQPHPRASAADGTITHGRGHRARASRATAARRPRRAAATPPACVAALPNGGFSVADTANNRVRRVTPLGAIFTVAGHDARAQSGDGGPAKAAQLNAARRPHAAHPAAASSSPTRATRAIRRVTDVGAVPPRRRSARSVGVEPGGGAVTVQPAGHAGVRSRCARRTSSR